MSFYNYTIPRVIKRKTIVFYCRRNARFPVHTSPPKKCSECAARFLIGPGLKATCHLTISMRGQRVTGKIQRNNYDHGNCGPSLRGNTMSVFLIFMQEMHRNVKNR